MNLRSKDISSIDLSNELDYLLIADFDDDTKWPRSVPKEYDIENQRIWNGPRFRNKKLHEEGITGQG